MLEETGLAYTVHPVNTRAGDQFKPDYLAISPNNKIPAIVDGDGPGGKPIAVFESGAILIYLAQKAGRFLPRREEDPAGHYAVLQWLMFQVGGVGPMLGQGHHFRHAARRRVGEDLLGYGLGRYENEAGRLYRVLDWQLAESDYIAGAYSIADIALYPWVRDPAGDHIDAAELPSYRRWAERMGARPAVGRGLRVLADSHSTQPYTEEECREHSELTGLCTI